MPHVPVRSVFRPLVTVALTVGTLAACSSSGGEKRLWRARDVAAQRRPHGARAAAGHPLPRRREVRAGRLRHATSPTSTKLGGGSGTFYEATWCDVEPTEGTYDWSELDEVTAQAESVGQELMLKVRVGSCWATGGQIGEARGAKAKTASTTPADMAKYDAFLNALVARYGARGVKEWAIENEVNNTAQWAGTPEEYVAARRARGGGHPQGAARRRHPRLGDVQPDDGHRDRARPAGAEQAGRGARGLPALLRPPAHLAHQGLPGDLDPGRAPGAHGHRQVEVQRGDHRGHPRAGQGRRDRSPPDALLRAVGRRAAAGGASSARRSRPTCRSRRGRSACSTSTTPCPRPSSAEEVTKTVSQLLAYGVARVLWLPLAADPNGTGGEEKRFGLLEPDGTPRPVADAYEQLVKVTHRGDAPAARLGGPARASSPGRVTRRPSWRGPRMLPVAGRLGDRGRQPLGSTTTTAGGATGIGTSPVMVEVPVAQAARAVRSPRR